MWTRVFSQKIHRNRSYLQLPLLFFSILIISFPPADSALAGNHSIYLPGIVSACPNTTKVIQCADCPKVFWRMTTHSLVLDAAKHPQIAYGGDHLYYAWNDGAVWYLEIVDTAPGTGGFAAIALDPTGKPVIGYNDSYNLHPKIARRSAAPPAAGTWSLQDVSLESGGATAIPLDFALDSNGNPHFVYYYWRSTSPGSVIDYLKYARWAGSAWQTFLVDDYVRYSDYNYAAMVLDNLNRPHIAYRYYKDYSHAGLRYATYNGSAWTYDLVSSDDSQLNAIALDRNGIPSIAYFNWASDLMLASRQGGAWTSEDITHTKGSYSVELSFDLSNIPLILFHNADQSYPTVYLYYKKGGKWDYTSITQNGYWASMVVDADGTPHISLMNIETTFKTKDDILYYVQPLNWSKFPMPGFQVDKVDKRRIVGNFPALAVSPTGIVHIISTDSFRRLWYAALTDCTWKTSHIVVHADSSSEDNSSDQNSIALDHAGIPHIATIDTQFGYLVYGTLNGGSWSFQTVATHVVGFDYSFGYYPDIFPSLAFDANDNAMISFYDYHDPGLKLARKMASGWQVEMVDHAGNVGLYSSLALDSSGNPNISYYDITNKDLKFAKWNGSTWAISVVDSAGDNGRLTSLALDHTGKPHISYAFVDAFQGNKYAYWNGSSWVIQVIQPGGSTLWDDQDMYSSIKVDSLNHPWISYYDKFNRHLALTHWNSSQWIKEIIDTNGENGRQSALYLDSNDVPYIAYSSTSNADLMFVKWSK